MASGDTFAGLPFEKDDLIYALLLLISVPFGFLVQHAKTAFLKQIISTAAGICLVYLVCGVHGLHSFITFAVNTILLFVLSPRYDHDVTNMHNRRDVPGKGWILRGI